MKNSLFQRIIDSPRPLWLTILISLILLLLPLAAAYIDGGLTELWQSGNWRVFLTPSIIIIYVLVISPPFNRVSREVVHEFRSAALVDDETYERVTQEADRLPGWGEPAAILTGLAFGILMNRQSFDPGAPWLTGVFVILMCIMYSMLAWTIYLSIHSTRLSTALHHLPLKIDIFDITPFEAVGRQGLLLALVFVGGITLSLLFAYQPESVRFIEFWLVYLVLALVPVVVFFLNMRPTHAVLAAEKKRQHTRIARLIHQGDQELADRLETGLEAGVVAAQQTALALYEKRILEARTWPYNTDMLRTLFVSVLIPGFTMFGKLFLDYFLPN